MEICKSCNKSMDLKSNVVQCTDCKLVGIYEFIKYQKLKIAELNRNCNVLRYEKYELKKDCKVLENRLQELEKSTRINNLEIEGIPVLKNEDVFSIIRDIGSDLGVEVKAEMIDFCGRLKRIPFSTRPPGIVVRFVRMSDKAAFLKASKEKRFYNMWQVPGHGVRRQILIKNSLLRVRRELFKDPNVQLDWRLAWIRNGMSVRRKRAVEDEDYSQPGPSQRVKKVAPFIVKSSSQPQNDESEYEPQDFSQSQTALSPEALTEISNMAVIKILSFQSSLRPFKRFDILHSTKAKGRVAIQVMEDAKKKLFDIFGVTLLEVEHQKYIIVNPMNKKLEKYIHEPKSPKRDLLGLLLTIIFVNNMQVHEDKLRECLQKVKVDLQDNHPYFGDVTKHLQEFERQLYIVKDYVATAKGQVEKSQPSYVWGVRAKHEISMNSILEVLAKIYDTTLENLPPSLKAIAARCNTEPESMEEFA